MTPGRQGEDEGMRRAETLEITVAGVWRQERVSCPHADVLRSYLDGGLPAGAMDYIRFHVEEAGCLYCGAELDALRCEEGGEGAAELEGVKERLLRSTRAWLRRVGG